MIVVELVGGLGNQMFQYAAGRAVADRLGVPLGLDTRPLGAPDSRPLRLDRFAIRADVVDAPDLLGVHGHRSVARQLRVGVLERLRVLITRPRPRLRHLTRVIHQAPSYSSVLDQVADDAWLCGYWQSERYFAGIRPALQRDFTLTRVSPETTALLAELARRTYAVAVHVRRGDYAHVASTRAYHGLLDASYYRTAMARVRARRPDAAFVFFSDEPGWVRDRFSSDATLVVSANADRPEEDLDLMRRCRSHIIANSSFSWWSAWLADSDEVIAPRSWYRAPHVDGSAVVPDTWTRL
jgi:hypothetical protein